MRPLAIPITLAFTITQLVHPPRASAEPQSVRKKLRRLGEATVFVIEGGHNPGKDYKYSDRHDEDNAIAKNSGLADATYANRVLLADWLTSDVARFTSDLSKIGKTIAAGTTMLSGPRFDLSRRIPLAIPETIDDTCEGACLAAYRTCTGQPRATGITATMTYDQRWCLYWEFRRALDKTIRTMIQHYSERPQSLWLDQPAAGGPAFSPYLAIALGTPVSFYSHNPLKPVGYHFDAKRSDRTRCTDHHERHKLVRGPVECSDFDLKIYSPDLTWNVLKLTEAEVKAQAQQDVEEKKAESDEVKKVRDARAAFEALFDASRGSDYPLTTEQERAIQDILPINHKIVDGGKRHVFKNTAAGKGVYERFPELQEFTEQWTAAFGREVDIKLEYSFNTPLYQAQPGGPIAVVDSSSSPGDAPPVPGAPPPPAEDEDRGKDEAGEDSWIGLSLTTVLRRD